jgi:hypothetical protein
MRCDVCRTVGPTVVYRGKEVCSVRCEDALDDREVWLDPVDLTVDSWMGSLPKSLRGMD